MAKTVLPNGETIPYDLSDWPNLVVISRGRKYRADGTGKMLDDGPAEEPWGGIIITGTAQARGAKATAVKQMKDVLADLETQGLGKAGGVEAPNGAPVRMTVKEFKDTFHKPGTTFHCPKRLKHELEE
jgi:hypothetical protein